jgi:hypothetical protein
LRVEPRSHSQTTPTYSSPTNARIRRVPSEAKPGIMVRAPALTAAALRVAIGKGNFYASTGVTLADVTADAERLSLAIEPRQTAFQNFSLRYSTRFIGDHGRVLATVAGPTPTYRFAGGETYVRAVVTDSNGKQAWTQPVFRDDREPRSPYGALERTPDASLLSR